MQFGLIEGKKVILKRESDFDKENKENIKDVIIAKIEQYVDEILNEKKINLEDIKLIGIAAPRNNKGWSNY